MIQDICTGLVCWQIFGALVVLCFRNSDAADVFVGWLTVLLAPLLLLVLPIMLLQKAGLFLDWHGPQVENDNPGLAGSGGAFSLKTHGWFERGDWLFVPGRKRNRWISVGKPRGFGLTVGYSRTVPGPSPEESDAKPMADVPAVGQPRMFDPDSLARRRR